MVFTSNRLFCFVCGAFPVLSVSSQLITTPGDVVAGRNFTLECRITRPPSDSTPVTWTQNTSRIYTALCASSIPVSPQSPPGLSGGCRRENGEEVYILRIENVTEDMGRAIWRCQYGFEEGVTVTLNVTVMVTGVTVQNRSSTLLAGTNTTFTCVTSPSTPQACIRGYMQSSGTVTELGSGDCNQDSIAVQTTTGKITGTTTWITTRTLRFTVSAEENGAVLYCTANNSVTDPPVRSQNHTINVHYGPVFNTCKSSYILHENDTAIELSCSTWANPEPRFNWSIQGQELINKIDSSSEYRQTSVVTFDKVNRNNSGIYIVTVDNGVGKVQRNATVTVYYAPDVDVILPDGNVTMEGICAKLECRAEGVPQNYTYSDWSHYIGDRPVPLLDSKPGKYLLISNVTFGDQGIYKCGASNGFGGIHVGQSIAMKMKAKPKFVVQDLIKTTELGEQVTLVSKFVSYPAYANITWYKLNDVSSQRLAVSDTGGNKYRQNVTEAEHEFLIYGIKVLIQGHVAELDIFNVTPDDIANYKLLVTNDIGRSGDVIPLQLSDRPYAPTLNPVICDTKQAEVTWVSTFNGGSIQAFVIEYKKEEEEWEKWQRDIPDPGKGNPLTKKISNLTQGHQYSFRVYGVNKWGESDKVEESCTVKVEDVPGNPSSHLTAAIAGGVSGGVVLVAVIVIIIVLRRTKFQWKSGPASEKQSQPLPPAIGLSHEAGGDGPYANVDDTGTGNGTVKTHSDTLMLSLGGGGAYEDVNIGSTTSEVTAGQGPEMERGKKKKKSDKVVPAGLYAEVTKGNRMQDVPAGLYAEVDREKKKKSDQVPEGPVYTEVEKVPKQPKEKPAVSRNQKPKSKTCTSKADSSNISDEDKMGLIRSKSKNGKPPSSAGTHVNAAFDADEVTYTNSGDISDVGASAGGNAKEVRGRDLLYADMNFDGTTPVVHPRDITTTYASIAYGDVGPPLQDEEDNEEDEKK